MKPTFVFPAVLFLFLPAGSARAETAEEALREALTWESQGQLYAAVAACDRALAVANLYWLQPALYTKAKVCLSAGCRDDALAAIQRLHAEYPESSSTVRAGILDAQMAGADPALAQAAYQRELEAGQQIDQALQLARQNQTETALDMLAGVAGYYPGSAAMLRAMDAQGHLLVRVSRDKEAMAVFADLLLRTGDATPNAFVVQRAKTRLGALCRSSGRIAEAEDIFEELAHYSRHPEVVARAALQLIGMTYEALRIETRLERPIDPARWANLESRCQQLMDSQAAPLIYRCKAEIVLLESHAWRHQCDDVYDTATLLFEKYKGRAECAGELATATFFVGEMLRYQKRYEEAIVHYQYVIDSCPPGINYWPGEQLLELAFYDLLHMKKNSGASLEEMRAIANQLAERFPQSVFNKGAKCVISEEERYLAQRSAKK